MQPILEACLRIVNALVSDNKQVQFKLAYQYARRAHQSNRINHFS
jgi:hypothetical protein